MLTTLCTLRFGGMDLVSKCTNFEHFFGEMLFENKKIKNV